jgi:Ni/Co efflux regulator RcnB
MKRIVLTSLMALIAVPTIASAQSNELRHDRREIREQQHDVNRAIRNGAPRSDVRKQRHDVREARREYRDDWRDYRRHNPGIYRGSRWVGPGNYRYHPVKVGHRFRSEFYARHYWIDPYRYHLRPVSSRQRWVRYGNDVLLIDIRTGRVLEVNRGFFF